MPVSAVDEEFEVELVEIGVEFTTAASVSAIGRLRIMVVALAWVGRESG